MKKVKIVLNTILTFLLVIIVSIVFLFLISKYIFKDEVPNVFGYSISRVVSGSMQPTIQIGDIIIIKKEDNYKVGDIVTYREKNGTLITHRIIKINESTVVTKGDYNNTEDSEISVASIQGKVIFKFHDIFRYLNFKIILIILTVIFVIGFIVTLLVPDKERR